MIPYLLMVDSFTKERIIKKRREGTEEEEVEKETEADEVEKKVRR